MHDIFTQYENKIRHILNELCQSNQLPPEVANSDFNIEPPREKNYGDMAVNVAMVLAKKAKQSPRYIAQLFIEHLEKDPHVATCSIAGAGFINITLTNACWHNVLANILQQSDTYGKHDIGKKESINIEFVSANPTGPLHVAHARGAVFGDVLASILEFCGYSITREYYVNNDGSQIDILIESFSIRYQQQCGIDDIVLDANLYPGQYLIDLAEELFKKDGDKWLKSDSEERIHFFRKYVLEHMILLIKKDLATLGIVHDVFFYESTLRKPKSTTTGNPLSLLIEQLQKSNWIYEGILPAPKGEEQDNWQPRKQLIFRSTLFGDDNDRPLFKHDDSPTYFANDIAYHYDKYLRGFKRMIDVLGADHAGYIKRIQASVEATTQNEASLEVCVCQLVRLMRDGEPVKMSKRSGEFITLAQVVSEVGSDALRYILLLRRNDMPIDFDLEIVKQQNADNPVFYLQYAYARIHSVKRHAQSSFNVNFDFTDTCKNLSLKYIENTEEIALIKKIAFWPRIVLMSALTRQPHRLVFYLDELATEFHKLWNLGRKNDQLRFIDVNSQERTYAKLALLEAIVIVLSAGMDILKIDKKETM